MASMPGMNMTGMAGMHATTTAGGANAAPAATPAAGMAGCDKDHDAAGGGAAQAAAGASAIGGGTDLASALAALTTAVKALAEAVAKMSAKATSGVAGVQGTAAATGQYVAPTTRAVLAGGQEDSSFEEQVLTLINKERAKAGLTAVVHNPLLDQAAEKHAIHMSQVNSMAHDGIGDGDPGERVRAEGFRNSWGENVAVGQRTPEQVVAEWMASPGHKRNIMDPNFKQSGIAQTQAADGRLYWAQEFGA
jgi:uncharacterized protein YkwD